MLSSSCSRLAAAVLLVAVVAPVIAQVPGLGSCPNITTVENFDVERYLGLWYENARYFALFELGGRCITANYTLRNDGNVSVVNSQINALTGNKNVIEGYATVVGDAKLSVRFPSLPVQFDAPYWIVSTDYDNYAVVWSCVDVSLLKARYAWLLTRERNPPQDILDKAYAAMDEKGISRTYLMKTDQKNCSD